MSLNCNEINLILEELSLEGAFIQEIIQPGFDTLALYTYKEGCAKTLLICTAQNSVRMNETRRKITKNDKPLRFMEFLRSRIKGCRINSVEQIGLERVVKMELSRLVEAKPKGAAKGTVHISLIKKPVLSKEELEAQEEPVEIEENYILYIKLWNNAANVILCDTDNTILEPMFRRPERGEVKGEKYCEPASDKEKIAQALERFPVREWKNEKAGGFEGMAQVNNNRDISNSVPAPEVLQGKTSLHPCETFNQYIDWWYSEHSDNLSREALLEKAEKWYNMFIEWGRPTYSIVKVEVDGNVYVGDAWNCFEGTIDKNKNLELAENYWKYEKNIDGKEPIVEILANGKIKVIEIVKENKEVINNE